MLKQITSLAEWNIEKSKDVIQQCYDSLEFTSKHEALSGEKVSDTVKITLALQNVRGNLAQSSDVSVSDTTTWTQINAILMNYFNNDAPVETKGVYQFNNTDKKEEVNFVKKRKAKVKIQKDFKKERIKRILKPFPEIRKEIPKAKERPNQKERVNGPLGHGITVRIGLRVRIKVIKGVAKANVRKERYIVRSEESQVIKLINAGGTLSSRELRISNNFRTQSKFTIFQSILRINQFRLFNQINFEDSKTYDQLLKFSQVHKSSIQSQGVSVFCSSSLARQVDAVVTDSTSIISFDRSAQTQKSRRSVRHFHTP